LNELEGNMADILIIDDDPDYAQALRDLLEAEGHRVRIGFDGAEGLDLVQQHMPDVTLLDVEMPVLGGPAMVSRMLIHDMGLENVPVVLLSGTPNLPEVARQVGTPYYLGKPYLQQQLVLLLNRVLAERAAPQPQRLGFG
jgi:CheY-like chemotaxis protein